MQNVNGDEATKKYIIETTGSGVAILDYDRDGWPDIYLVNGNALEPSTVQNKSPTGHLYHNNHDGTFTDVTRAAGLTASGWGQGACVGDYDNDGFDDLYVTYYGKNRLYHNEGNGTFKEEGLAAGVAFSRNCDVTAPAIITPSINPRRTDVLRMKNIVHISGARI